jgi:tetratricopeptide (TPR) repeat protein
MKSNKPIFTLLIFIITQILILFTYSIAETINEEQVAIEKALEAEKKDPDTAINILLEAYKIINVSYLIPFHLGRMYFEKAEQSSTNSHLNKAANEKELAKSISNNKQNNYHLATTYLYSAVQAEPKNPDPWLLLGKIDIRLERYKEAAFYFDKYLAVVPEDPEILFLQGIAYSSIDKNKEASKNFEKCIKLNSNNGEYYYNLGIVKLKQKNYTKSVQYLHEAANLFNVQKKTKELSDSFAYIGLAYIRSKKINDGIKNYEFAIQADSKNSIGYFNLAAFYVKKELYDKALQLYSSYLNHVTDDEEVYSRIVSLLDKTKKFKPGISIMNKVLGKEPKNLLALYYLAHLYDMDKDEENAIKIFQECINTAGENSYLTIRCRKNIEKLESKTKPK